MRHTEQVHKAVATIASIAAAAHQGAAKVDPNAVYAYRTLANPTSGDEFGFRGAIQQNAQGMSDRLFQALQGILGGQAPRLNFTQPGDALTPDDFSATPAGNTINVNPMGTWAFTDNNSPYHNAGVTDVPHEMAHLRQTAQVLADMVSREGGAQAFANLVTPVAAQRAGIKYAPGNYDGTYANITQAVMPRGNDWLTGTQFGHAPVAWP